MQFHMQTNKDKVTVSADVTKIEVADIVASDEEEPVESYFRTIRFVTSGGEAIEVFGKAFDNKNTLRLHRIKELKPVKKPKQEIWLEPEVYTGTTGEDTEQESD
jgi:hypothetical protein